MGVIYERNLFKIIIGKCSMIRINLLPMFSLEFPLQVYGLQKGGSLQKGGFQIR